MKWWFFLWILVLLPMVHATSLLNGYKYNYDTFTIGSNIYSITAYNQYTALRLQVNGNTTYLLRFGKCVDDGYMQYCYNETNWDKATIDKYDQTSPALKLLIYTIDPKITITRTIIPKPAEFDQTMDVTVKIANTGTNEAFDLSYIEKVPDNVLVILSSGNSRYEGNTIFWNSARLSIGKEQTFTYRVQPLKYINGKNTAFINYTYEDISKNTTSSSLDFSIKTPYSLKTSLNKASPGIGELEDYTISLQNLETDKNLQAYLVITIPLELDIVSNLQLTPQGGNVFILNTTLLPKDTKDLTLRVKGDFTGSYNFSTLAQFLVNGKYLYVKEVKSMKITSTKISPEIFLSLEDIRAGEPFETTLVLTNKDKVMVYKNINARFYSSLFQEILAVDAIAPGKDYQFKNRYFSRLEDNVTNIPLEVSGTFESLNGEKFSFYTKKVLKVGPANKTLDITQVISNKTTGKNQVFTVETFVQNSKDDPVNDIQVDDYFSEDLILTQGKTATLIPSIPGDKKVSAYAYQLQVPETYNKPNITIVSRLTTIIQGQEFTRSIQTVLPVQNTTLNGTLANGTIIGNITNPVNVTKNITKVNVTGKNNTTKPPVPTSKDAGFFGKLWDGIKGFFQGIFGSKK
jgi:hypothetical protein